MVDRNAALFEACGSSVSQWTRLTRVKAAAKSAPQTCVGPGRLGARSGTPLASRADSATSQNAAAGRRPSPQRWFGRFAGDWLLRPNVAAVRFWRRAMEEGKQY